ncbi:pyridoxal kinase [Pneumocystis jirovecii RU7]|uniref:pyridoxal kinase n=1 Tax=Pneumocystis jirovecii (strain RU7) TaxID=1408657 RepID=A0A0W4ZHP7_PNEJ7|nr:pyridoxal kinase [Pneumocystis jirovecii RU7]KTW27883.1 pyridoxal kinase [Pneumocystis jirovecii RU7]
MTDLPLKYVLSIQSSVCWGYCGNRSATFPLQLLGYDVSVIHTVQFSNHTGYGHWRGQTFSGQHLADLYKGLKDNGIFKEYNFLLTGYVPGKEGVESMACIAKDIKENNPTIGWLLDPVLGDNGRLYVSSDVIPIYKQLLFICDLITPNQFEAETLSDKKISSFETLLTCLKSLHKSYCLKHIVVTSIRFGADDKELHIIASSCKSDYTPRAVKITVPYYDYTLVGTGDLFSALLLARFNENMKSMTPDDVSAIHMPLTRALELVVSSVQDVIKNTISSIKENYAHLKNQLSKAEMFKLCELRVIQSQDFLKNPSSEYKAIILK